MKKKPRANAKGQAGGYADVDTPSQYKNKWKICDEDDTEMELNSVKIDSGDEISGINR